MGNWTGGTGVLDSKSWNSAVQILESWSPGPRILESRSWGLWVLVLDWSPEREAPLSWTDMSLRAAALYFYSPPSYSSSMLSAGSVNYYKSHQRKNQFRLNRAVTSSHIKQIFDFFFLRIILRLKHLSMNHSVNCKIITWCHLSECGSEFSLFQLSHFIISDEKNGLQTGAPDANRTSTKMFPVHKILIG